MKRMEYNSWKNDNFNEGAVYIHLANSIRFKFDQFIKIIQGP